MVNQQGLPVQRLDDYNDGRIILYCNICNGDIK